MKIQNFVYPRITPLFLALIGSASLAMMGCKKAVLESAWMDREISVDGDHSDWQGALTYVEDEEVSVGLMNDSESLYVCLVPGSRLIERQIMGMGFTVWLDAEGGKKKTFGIRYPLGMMGSGMSHRELGFAPDSQEDSPDRGRMREALTAAMSDLEILRSEEEDAIRLGIDEAEGVDVEIGNVGGTFVYELRVPLREDADHPFAVGAKEGGVIGLGFETGEMDREKMREEMTGRMGGRGGVGGRGGMGGMGGGRMGGGMRGMGGRGSVRPEMPQPIRVWTRVRLAECSE